MANAFDVLKDDGTVKKLSAFASTGKWAITGVEAGKPLYILGTVETDYTGKCAIHFDAVSGTNDAKGVSGTNYIHSYVIGFGDENSSTNCLIVVPTDSTVVFDIKALFGKLTLNAYQ